MKKKREYVAIFGRKVMKGEGGEEEKEEDDRDDSTSAKKKPFIILQSRDSISLSLPPPPGVSLVWRSLYFWKFTTECSLFEFSHL